MLRHLNSKTAWFSAVVLGTLVLCTVGLGARPFWDYDEAIYAQIMHDMAASGDVWVPSRDGQPFFEKPPLYFWGSIALDRVFNTPEWSYRALSALAGVLTVLLTMLFVWEVSGSLFASVLAGTILATTGAFIEASRQLRLDIPTTAMIVLAALCFERGRRDSRWLAGIGIAIAVGFLFKMVIALLAGVYIAVRAIGEREWSWIKSPSFWGGIVAGVLIVVPWHAYMAIRFGSEFWDGYFWHNVVDRTGSDVLGGTQTIGEFLSYYVAYAAPWSILFVLGIGIVVTRIRARGHDAADRALIACTGTSFVLLCVFLMSRTRIFYYLLPMYPFMAATLGLLGARLLHRANVFVHGGIVLSVLIAVYVTGATAFHRFETFRVNDQIVGDETRAARSIAQHDDSLPLFAYEYFYWDTIGYYANHGRIKAMSDDMVLDRPFYLIVSTPYMQWHQFDPVLQAHLRDVYAGDVVTVYRFEP